MKSKVTIKRLIFAISAFFVVIFTGNSIGNPRPPFFEMVALPITAIVLLSDQDEFVDAARCYVGAIVGAGVVWLTSFPEHVGSAFMLVLLGWFLTACYNLIRRRRRTPQRPPSVQKGG